jgi:hypothetical protein
MVIIGFSPIILIKIFIVLQWSILGLLLWKFKDLDWDR